MTVVKDFFVRIGMDTNPFKRGAEAFGRQTRDLGASFRRAMTDMDRDASRASDSIQSSLGRLAAVGFWVGATRSMAQYDKGLQQVINRMPDLTAAQKKAWDASNKELSRSTRLGAAQRNRLFGELNDIGMRVDASSKAMVAAGQFASLHYQGDIAQSASIATEAFNNLQLGMFSSEQQARKLDEVYSLIHAGIKSTNPEVRRLALRMEQGGMAAHEYQMALAVLKGQVKDTGRLQRDAAKDAKGYSGQMDTLGNNLKLIYRTFGETIAPVLRMTNALVGGLAKAMERNPFFSVAIWAAFGATVFFVLRRTIQQVKQLIAAYTTLAVAAGGANAAMMRGGVGGGVRTGGVVGGGGRRAARGARGVQTTLPIQGVPQAGGRAGMLGKLGRLGGRLLPGLGIALGAWDIGQAFTKDGQEAGGIGGRGYADNMVTMGLTGAAIGSIIPGVGTLAGGLIGAGLGAASTWAGKEFGFAKGGIIRKPVRGIIGENGPEAIIPLNDPKAMAMLGPAGLAMGASNRLAGRLHKGALETAGQYVQGGSVGVGGVTLNFNGPVYMRDDAEVQAMFKNSARTLNAMLSMEAN